MKITYGIKVTAAVILVIILSNGIAKGQNLRDVDRIIEEIKSSYEGITDFKAEFVMTQRVNGTQSRMEGKIWIKEGKFKIKTKPELTVFDGKIIWQYLPPKNIVIKMSLEEFLKKARGKIPHNWKEQIFKPSLKGDFKVSEKQEGEENFYTLENIPSSGEKSTSYKKILWIRADDYLMQKREFYDKEGNLIFSQEFDHIEVNEGISEDEFIFHIPRGAKVINIGQPTRQK